MQPKTVDNDDQKYFNIGIFGSLNAGKCSLAKTISIACGCISTPNNFIYNSKNYFVLPIPCSPLDFIEKYDIASNFCDIAIIVIDINQIDNLQELKLKIIDIMKKSYKIVLFCLNKIDLFAFNEESLIEIKENIYSVLNDEIFKFYNMRENVFNEPVYISAKEELNISEKILETNNEFFLLSAINQLTDALIPYDNKLLFIIYDFYTDTEENYVVITGKNLNDKMEINKEYTLVPNNKTITISKISTCTGNYVKSIRSNQFVSV